LLEKSMARFDIDPEKSFFIGDAERDVEAGRKAGIQAIRIQPNSSLLAIVPDIIGT
jgi:D-glycero-D-manno-heptose 1,7-bisphosphate phosphatase